MSVSGERLVGPEVAGPAQDFPSAAGQPPVLSRGTSDPVIPVES
jgi:hypothetical protein